MAHDEYEIEANVSNDFDMDGIAWTRVEDIDTGETLLEEGPEIVFKGANHDTKRVRRH